MYQSGQKVIRVIEGAGGRTATFKRVKSSDGERTCLEGDGTLAYSSATGDEIDPAIPGFRSYLVEFDDGEEARVSYPGDSKPAPRRVITKKARSARTTKKVKKVGKRRGR